MMNITFNMTKKLFVVKVKRKDIESLTKVILQLNCNNIIKSNRVNIATLKQYKPRLGNQNEKVIKYNSTTSIVDYIL